MPKQAFGVSTGCEGRQIAWRKGEMSVMCCEIAPALRTLPLVAACSNSACTHRNGQSKRARARDREREAAQSGQAQTQAQEHQQRDRRRREQFVNDPRVVYEWHGRQTHADTHTQ